jgi:hypothetical protein
MVRYSRKTGDHHRQMLDRGVYDPDEFDAWLAGRGWSWGMLQADMLPIGFDQALLLFTIEDPVRWCEAFMLEHDGTPFRFFDYQKPSIRAWNQDVVHEDAAEVGKTREIVALLLWGHVTGCGFTQAQPSSLVGAPQQIFLNEIMDAIERQIGVFKAMPGESPLKSAWLEPRRTPHTQFRILCPNMLDPGRTTMGTIDFRPAGHDGEAFRGVHVRTFALLDEAAKMKSKLQWSEFYRSLMPGCRFRGYSVPDGDRNSEFYRVCQAAVPDLPQGAPGTRKFHWPKTIMPAPFWSQERDAHFVKLYGGRDTPGYQRNVLGLWGDAEDPVFRWGDILPNVVDLPDYRRITLSADTKGGQLYATVERIALQINDGKMAGQPLTLADMAEPIADFTGKDADARRAAWRELLEPWLGHLRGQGVFWAGADLGERNDPTEIFVFETVGETDVLRVRIKATGLPYHAQKELLFQIDRLFGHRPFWGMDMGSAGTVVVKDLCHLEEFEDARFDERLIGFHFQQTVDMVGEDGEALTQDKDDGSSEVLRAPAKHWATQCMVARLQQGGYRLPYDGDVLNDMTCHTARQGAKWPIYSTKNDHTVDALRMAMLRKLASLEGDTVDVFSVGAYRRADFA